MLQHKYTKVKCEHVYLYNELDLKVNMFLLFN